MVKHIQTIRRQKLTNYFECDHFVGLALKGLTTAISDLNLGVNQS